jgi:hypothetical protein
MSNGDARNGDIWCKHRQFRRFGNSDTPLFSHLAFLSESIMMFQSFDDVVQHKPLSCQMLRRLYHTKVHTTV